MSDPLRSSPTTPFIAEYELATISNFESVLEGSLGDEQVYVKLDDIDTIVSLVNRLRASREPGHEESDTALERGILSEAASVLGMLDPKAHSTVATPLEMAAAVRRAVQSLASFSVIPTDASDGERRFLAAMREEADNLEKDELPQIGDEEFRLLIALAERSVIPTTVGEEPEARWIAWGFASEVEWRAHMEEAGMCQECESSECEHVWGIAMASGDVIEYEAAASSVCSGSPIQDERLSACECLPETHAEFCHSGPAHRGWCDMYAMTTDPARSSHSGSDTPDRAWERRARPWNDFPLGTEARNHNHMTWTRVADGWKAKGGDTFPTPAADALEVLLPPT